MDKSKLTQNILIKSVEIENEGNKYICKIQLINEILNISLYLNNNILKYEGNIILRRKKYLYIYYIIIILIKMI